MTIRNYKTKITISLVGIILASSTFFNILPQASAATITLSPPKFDETLAPGDIVEKVVKIMNNSPQPIILTPSVQDFAAAADESGNPSFLDPEDNNSSYSLASWVKINPAPISIKPQEQAKIPFSIQIPMEAEPGGHYGTLFFAPPSAGVGNIMTQQKIGTLLLVRVKGAVEENGSLETFGLFKDKVDASSIDSARKKRLFTAPPIEFTVRFKNDGNVHLRPKGKITIYNTFGQQVKKIGEEKVLSSAGAVTKAKRVDYIPVNDDNGSVLPKSIRRFNPTWAKAGGLHLGRYTAALELDYGSTGHIENIRTSFWIIPLWFYFLLLLLIILVIGGIFFLRSAPARRQRKAEAKIKAEEELRAKIRQELQNEQKTPSAASESTSTD